MPRIVAELQFELRGGESPGASTAVPLDLPLGDLAVFSEMGISLSVATRA